MESQKKCKAYQFQNCVNEPIWDVKVSHCAPPYLHIVLGVVKKHHDLLVNDCHNLDIALAEEYSSDEKQMLNNTFGNFVLHLRKMRLRMDQRHELVTSPVCCQRKLDEIDYRIKRHANTLLYFAPHEGPIASSLEERMELHHISIQAYHSRSMVGNHCHKYVQPAVFGDICQHMVQKTKELSSEQIIIIKAKEIFQKYTRLINLFSTVHIDVCHGNYIPRQSISTFKKK